MSTELYVVCLKDTGHVLAAMTGSGLTAAPDIESLVGSGLSIAGTHSKADSISNKRTLIPASVLEVKSVAYDVNVLGNPMHHAVNGGAVAEIPASSSPSVTLTANDIELTGGTVGTKGLAVVALKDNPEESRRVQSGDFVDADGNGSVDPLTLPLHILPGDTPAAIESGDYDVFVALAGMRPYWVEEPAP